MPTEVEAKAAELQNALDQWVVEPANAPHRNPTTGLTQWAEATMNLAGELCELLGAKSALYGDSGG